MPDDHIPEDGPLPKSNNAVTSAPPGGQGNWRLPTLLDDRVDRRVKSPDVV